MLTLEVKTDNMKLTLLFCSILLCSATLLHGQQQAQLLGTWKDSSLIGSSAYNNTYNEIWGMAVNGHEYAIVGSTAGTHFIDITNPETPFEAHFVPGAAQGGAIIHRDYHDYRGYLYAVCDEGASTLQIIDTRQLPDTIIVAYDTDAEIRQAHNIFIDTTEAKLYAFAVNGGTQGYAAMRIYDISEPLQPTYIDRYNNFGGLVAGHVHDGYVRDGIAFLNCGGAGFAMMDFSDPNNPVPISTVTEYPFRGYNHSGWLTDDGSHYYMADENHGFDIKAIDVSDPCQPEIVGTFDAEVDNPLSITHNQIVACNYLYVSYYYEGLVVFDITDPAQPEKVLYYGTSSEAPAGSYKGAWGVYPLLPSGRILVSDMQEGLFVFEGMGDNCAAQQQLSPVNLDCLNPIATRQASAVEALRVYPQPTRSQLQLDFSLAQPQPATRISLYDVTGREVQLLSVSDLPAGEQQLGFELRAGLPAGLYLLRLQGQGWQWSERVVVR